MDQTGPRRYKDKQTPCYVPMQDEGHINFNKSFGGLPPHRFWEHIQHPKIKKVEQKVLPALLSKLEPTLHN